MVFDSNSAEPTRSLSEPREPSRISTFISRHSAFIVLLAVLGAQLLLVSFQITRNHNVRLIQVWAVEAFSPFESTIHTAVQDTVVAWKTYKDLWKAERENYELHAQLISAQWKLEQVSEQAAEARRLRGLLNLKDHMAFRTVAAEVIAASPGETSNAVYIDKGYDSNLTADLPVITPQGVVGKIVAVFPHSAQVLLLTDPSSGVGCLLANSRIQGVLKGQDHGLCKLDYVMNDQQVTVGEAVRTSGLDRIYPKGLPVGIVVKIRPGGIYKTILVKPTAELNKLDGVLVVFKTSEQSQEAVNFRPQ